ncbi:TIGR00294 family protein [Methanomethylovorans hollandica DSM 15978]|jgi:GTP cyclohydrolase-4|uniref:GTP cyclohydrolase MptA n=1 Tax=Methanomethylovorans hollandica (strain DSM 15978 / NBRC 107637 / DMS1) TaxID=867904 RepID=L0KT06_METHD|nr:GTP cyclohydrolase MptA [Methanomethylovorans hollandica]AGB48567.1 TIGR00294 family protein [Methanomethylovorans hollandica DSM 15978]
MELSTVILPDIQANKPKIPMNLTRVGVTNVKKLVAVKRKDKRPVMLISTFDIFVDLPSDRKGANLSRNFEAVDEVLEKAVNMPVYEIEQLCSDVALNLLVRHEYATRAEVHLKSEYVIKRESPATKMECQEVVEIFAEAKAGREEGGNINVTKLIGAEVVGMTACPCAQEIMTDNARKQLEEIGVENRKIAEFLHRVPMATHNQRGRGIISIEVASDDFIFLEKVISIIERSMSSSVFELLKRSDEAMVVQTAHKNPKFVEDCVRTMAHNVVKEFKDLPDDAIVTIKQINEESIHRHNAFAERVATMGELRKEISN